MLRPVLQHPLIGRLAVRDARAARVLGHQTVIDSEDTDRREPGQAGGDVAVAVRAAGRERATVDIQQAPVRVARGNPDPLGRHAAGVDLQSFNLQRFGANRGAGDAGVEQAPGFSDPGDQPATTDLAAKIVDQTQDFGVLGTRATTCGRNFGPRCIVPLHARADQEHARENPPGASQENEIEQQEPEYQH